MSWQAGGCGPNEERMWWLRAVIEEKEDGRWMRAVMEEKQE